MSGLDLRDRVAVVTGATGDIGGAVARRLAAEGCRLVVHGHRDEAAMEKLDVELERLGTEFVRSRGSVSDPEYPRRLMDTARERFGRLDVLVNTAGVTRDKPVGFLNDADWNEVLAVNLSGVFLCCRAAIKLMIPQRAGCIVNLSSASALYGRAGQAGYAASKAGVLAFTRSLAREVGRYELRVNAVVVGMIDGGMTRRIPGALRRKVAEQTCLRRLGRAEEVATVVSFLASDMASYMTAGAIPVDGGL